MCGPTPDQQGSMSPILVRPPDLTRSRDEGSTEEHNAMDGYLLIVALGALCCVVAYVLGRTDERRAHLVRTINNLRHNNQNGAYHHRVGSRN